MDLKAILARYLRQFPFNLFSPRLWAQNYTVGAKFGFIFLEIPYRQFALSYEAVPECLVARRNPAIRNPQRAPIQHRQQPANRPNKSRAIDSRPGHRARPG